jgi:surface-adhesin protein E
MRPTFVLALIVALPYPLVSASKQARWKEIGKTSTGNSVFVDPTSVKKDNGIITAKIRVKFATPVALQNGDHWVMSHHVAMFDCATSRVAAKESVYYSDAAATKVVQRSTIAKPGFGPALGGSMTKVALDYLCKG